LSFRSQADRGLRAAFGSMDFDLTASLRSAAGDADRIYA
jgi:hypothetical protein